ncbi:hypothetical protein BHE74_00021697 [Ensete ventricosum]|nr:hypothetical protein GW17_00013677 [Ensete ventricosum]RWW70608.1 hypothetical protein BHE74_00021697 [Ensete ventricosum]RZS02950.1 hypothetical protein BHM03_00033054 [Ensete ventricosum]
MGPSGPSEADARGSDWAASRARRLPATKQRLPYPFCLPFWAVHPSTRLSSAAAAAASSLLPAQTKAS